VICVFDIEKTFWFSIEFEKEKRGPLIEAADAPSLALTIREAPRKNPSDSLAFRELLPQSADRRRFDEVGEAAQAAASAIRVFDRSGDSWARIKKPPQNARQAAPRGPPPCVAVRLIRLSGRYNPLTKFHRTRDFVCDLLRDRSRGVRYLPRNTMVLNHKENVKKVSTDNGIRW
jgi:hypothetical protein